MIVHPDRLIEVPACNVCHDWMFAATLWVWPVDAICWVCVNGCATLIHGKGSEELIPDESAAHAISAISLKVAENVE